MFSFSIQKVLLWCNVSSLVSYWNWFAWYYKLISDLIDPKAQNTLHDLQLNIIIQILKMSDFYWSVQKKWNLAACRHLQLNYPAFQPSFRQAKYVSIISIALLWQCDAAVSLASLQFLNSSVYKSLKNKYFSYSCLEL